MSGNFEREKRNTHLITSFTYIIRQYTIVYLKKNFEAIKHLAVHSDITKKNYETILKMLNALFRITFQHFVRLPISFYNRKMNSFFLMFNVVVFIDFFEKASCLMALKFSLHYSWCHDIKRFEIYH
jgi:hypothetical protein